MNNSQGNDQGNSRYVSSNYTQFPQVSGLLKNASKLSLSQSHTIVRSLGDTG